MTLHTEAPAATSRSRRLGGGSLALTLVALGIASPSAAAVETLIGRVSAESGERVIVDVRFLNTGAAQVDAAPPDLLEATFVRDGTPEPVVLERIGSAAAIVAAGSFVQIRYHAAIPASAGMIVPTGSRTATTVELCCATDRGDGRIG